MAALLRQVRIDWLCKDGKIDQAVASTDEMLGKNLWQLEPRQVLIGGLVKSDNYPRAEKQIEAWLTQLEASAATQPALTQPAKPPAPVPGMVIEIQPAPARASPGEILAWHREMLVRIILMQNQHQRSVERAKAFLVDHPDDVDLLSAMALGLAEMGQRELARQTLEKAFKLKSDDPGLNNDLGYHYADEGIELDKAERMIRKALAEHPTAAVLDSLGWLRYKQGMFDQARRILEQALREMATEGREHPVMFEHLGDVWARLGNLAQAQTHWQKALDLAAKEKFPSAEVRSILKKTPAKIEAVKAGRPPEPAPLGKGVISDQVDPQ
ncbi:MAG: Tetratricopeptide repeat protein [Deltaproteobacteria bacterium ADurb.Bin510]|nr:MAG: Tetratricopeptide repeat protein [Deltaproteobacteria bacterium ADurb.Bin510]